MSAFEWLSFFLDISPVIGETKSVLECITGKDLITQEDLDDFDRVTSALSIIPIAGWLAKIPKASKAAKLTSKFEKFLTVMNKANKVVDVLDKFNYIKQIYEMNSEIPCGFKLDPIISIQHHNNLNFDISKDIPDCFKTTEKKNDQLSKMVRDTLPYFTSSMLKNNKHFNDIFLMGVMRNHRKSIDELATEIIRGNWGNGEERKRRLEEAGYNYQEVQNEVNRRLRK